jgi:hypothetical protein
MVIFEAWRPFLEWLLRGIAWMVSERRPPDGT